MTTTLPRTEERRRTGLLAFFQPDPVLPVTTTEPAEVAAAYKRWQFQVLLWSIIGYALYYFVRKNLSIAMPEMGRTLGIGKPQLGLFLTLHGLIYGLSKFVNGYFGDRANARTFMAVGLLLSAAMNVCFGLSSSALLFGVFWMLNGWFQGMGFPPCARLMTHWFHPKELATKMSIWNSSHSIGAGLVVVMCGYLVGWSWRLCFFVPAALAAFGALVMLFTVPDTPASKGLPEMAGTLVAEGDHRPTDDVTDNTQTKAEFRSFVRTHVFGNPYIWIISVANFFVYSVRYAVLDWGPTLLNEAKHVKLSNAGWMVAAFEISGIIGMLASGWITDRVFGGRGSRTCLFSMIGCVFAVVLLWRVPAHSALLYTLLLCVAGFFIYGPQALVGITVANLATKRAAATAVGLTGIFGYASTIVSGWGLGVLVQSYGWDYGFKAMLMLTALGVVLFAAAWGAKSHGYATA